MSILRKIVLGMALVASLAVAIFFGWRLYRHWTRPDIARDGGTILVYEIDEARWAEGKRPEDYSPEKLVAALKQRLDPGDLYGVTVRPISDTRFEIALPREGADHAAQVRKAEDLIARSGKLEFRIVANTDDDKDGIDAARAQLASLKDNPAEVKKLEAAASAGKPPPGPAPAGRQGIPQRPGLLHLLLGRTWPRRARTAAPRQRHRGERGPRQLLEGDGGGTEGG